MGKLIVIEGMDGSGKATQAALLYSRLVNLGVNVKKIEFPNYDSPSSALVKMYLNGDFGKDPGAVDPQAASIFYAIDRYASFKTDWGKFYATGGVIIADRYTTSNMVHQAAKIDTNHAKNAFLDWLCDLEFNILGLPRPDCVAFLDMPPHISLEFLRKRDIKSQDVTKDIHEANQDYLLKSYLNACVVADKYGWKKIPCVHNDIPKTIGEIHSEVYAAYEEMQQKEPKHPVGQHRISGFKEI